MTDGTSNTPLALHNGHGTHSRGTWSTSREIKSWQQEQATSHTPTDLPRGISASLTDGNAPVLLSDSVNTDLFKTTQTGHEARFHVPSDDIEKVKQLLSGLGLRTIVQEAPGQSLIFRIDMYQDTERAKERVVAS